MRLGRPGPGPRRTGPVTSALQVVDVELRGVDDLVGQVAELPRAPPVPGRCRPARCPRGRADGGAGSPRSGGPGSRPRRRGRPARRGAPRRAAGRGCSGAWRSISPSRASMTRARRVSRLGQLGQPGELRHEHHREVVDAEVAGVLQRPDRGGLARPRHPGEDHDAPAVVRLERPSLHLLAQGPPHRALGDGAVELLGELLGAVVALELEEVVARRHLDQGGDVAAGADGDGGERAGRPPRR